MPRWRALPEELDPQVREFAEHLRRLVERSGLGIGAVADRTGYSKTSWERYLNGRLLPPRGAVEALAEVTGTDPRHLGTLWELAERAWSRAELRHDETMEAVRVAEARAALSEAEAAPPRGARSKVRSALRAEGTGPEHGDREPDRVNTGLPRSPEAADVRDKAIPLRAPAGGGPRPKARRRRNVVLFAVGAAGALLVAAAAVLLWGGEDDAPAPAPAAAAPGPSGSQSAQSPAPTGVKCTGSACAGQDPEAMGCGGLHATTAGSATVGTSYLEVRYSKACGTAWARITQAVPGDSLRISATGAQQSGRVDRGADGHTRMIAVTGARQASACATLVSGRKGCTTPRTAEPGPTG
ncbi:hypothetical protein GCM10010218_31660 [Streptomyces mashuensis]|uniref:HTH cro/C1-type domain-containing protein n=1 Tax=Streptomyces mashuensis TaxID=33904 RepID=A0A919B4Q9_9ACTN|nr:XRE family transcriptional regulator [Streptomyces mashuensis]GHF47892.1 hypothetical protein GCM10010218_31660 [Streptomyces mashuensis]